ncbi:MFS transporter [Streptomyces zaomyceticus]|nr:MFS transporter [Streptomyces zaomyceticus]
MQLFLIGALGPRLVDRLGVSETLLGLTTTVGFGTAAVLSPAGGRIVDRVGPRRALVALLGVSAGALALIGAAPGPALLLVAVALGGLPQALANPATNKAILAAVPAPRRGAVTGTKQSGVQLGAFAAGLPLAAVAGVIGWRGAVWVAAGASLLAAVWAWRALPADAPPRSAAAPSHRPAPVGPCGGSRPSRSSWGRASPPSTPTSPSSVPSGWAWARPWRGRWSPSWASPGSRGASAGRVPPHPAGRPGCRACSRAGPWPRPCCSPRPSAPSPSSGWRPWRSECSPSPATRSRWCW